MRRRSDKETVSGNMKIELDIKDGLDNKLKNEVVYKIYKNLMDAYNMIFKVDKAMIVSELFSNNINEVELKQFIEKCVKASGIARKSDGRYSVNPAGKERLELKISW